MIRQDQIYAVRTNQIGAAWDTLIDTYREIEQETEDTE
jgi:hypothetical protein